MERSKHSSVTALFSNGTDVFKKLFLCYLSQHLFAKESRNRLHFHRDSRILRGEGACRVHGGGFAGTIQAFVPEKKLEAFKAEMERVFGEGSCYVLSIRPVGGVQIDL